MDGVFFDDATADDILDVVHEVQGGGSQVVHQAGTPVSLGVFWYVKLTEDLAPATDPDTPATATANVGRARDDDTLEDTEKEITVTNRFASFSGSNGDLITVVREEGEYVPNSPGGGKKLVMLCANLAGRSSTGQNGGVLGTVSQAPGAVLGAHPEVADRVIQTGESITVSNIWDIDFTAGQLIAVENGLLGFNWTPYGADCGSIESTEPFWDEYEGDLGCN